MPDVTEDKKTVKEKSVISILLNIIYVLIGVGILALFIIMFIRSRA